MPYTVRLDAEAARELAARGAAIVLLDVPPGTAVGIDQQARGVGVGGAGGAAGLDHLRMHRASPLRSL